jgi:colanic acid biosynthesis protein WcaH
MKQDSSAYADAIQVLESWAPDPNRGLPEPLFLLVSKLTPMINVDLVIADDQHRTLLTWRSDDLHGSGWHIPGGIIRYQETMEARIRATARAELGARLEFDPAPIAIEQLILPNRYARGHMISIAFRCRLVDSPDPKLRYEGGDPEAGQWAWHLQCPSELIEVQTCYRRFFRPEHTPDAVG